MSRGKPPDVIGRMKTGDVLEWIFCFRKFQTMLVRPLIDQLDSIVGSLALLLTHNKLMTSRTSDVCRSKH